MVKKTHSRVISKREMLVNIHWYLFILSINHVWVCIPANGDVHRHGRHFNLIFKFGAFHVCSKSLVLPYIFDTDLHVWYWPAYLILTCMFDTALHVWHCTEILFGPLTKSVVNKAWKPSLVLRDLCLSLKKYILYMRFESKYVGQMVSRLYSCI